MDLQGQRPCFSERFSSTLIIYPARLPDICDFRSFSCVSFRILCTEFIFHSASPLRPTTIATQGLRSSWHDNGKLSVSSLSYSHHITSGHQQDKRSCRVWYARNMYSIECTVEEHDISLSGPNGQSYSVTQPWSCRIWKPQATIAKCEEGSLVLNTASEIPVSPLYIGRE